MSRNLLKQIALPLFFLALSLITYIIWKLLNLPSQPELIQIAKDYFQRYGLITIFVSSIIEGVLLLGWYYPGSLVIFLGVIFAGKDIPRVATAIIIITIGLFIAFIIDFLLGKYGWYRLLLKFGLKGSLESAKKRLTKYGLPAIYLSFWHPNLSAITSTAAGILQFSLKKFLAYSLSATILWNLFWGTIVYFLGEASLGFIGIKFIIILIAVWIIYRIWLAKAGAKNKIL